MCLITADIAHPLSVAIIRSVYLLYMKQLLYFKFLHHININRSCNLQLNKGPCLWTFTPIQKIQLSDNTMKCFNNNFLIEMHWVQNLHSLNTAVTTSLADAVSSCRTENILMHCKSNIEMYYITQRM